MEPLHFITKLLDIKAPNIQIMDVINRDTLKDSDDIKLVKILRNKAHLHLPIETVTPLTVSTSQDIIFGRREKSCSK